MRDRLKILRYALLLISVFAYLQSDGQSVAAAALDPPICSEICDSSSSCSEGCYENMMEYENGNEIDCGEYGTCDEPPSDPCDPPNYPVWVAVSGSEIGRFAYHDFDTGANQWYCQHYINWRHIEEDQQACVSARQPDRGVCYHLENGARRYWPDDNMCCWYDGCGGSYDYCTQP